MNWSRFSNPCDDRSDDERAEHLQAWADERRERRRDDEMMDGKTGSDIDAFLQKHPTAEFKENE